MHCSMRSGAEMKITIMARFGDPEDDDMGVTKTFSFDTHMEANAFMEGVEEACGWFEYEVLQDGRY